MIIETADEHGLQPLFVVQSAGPNREIVEERTVGLAVHGGWYDLDQIKTIHDGIKRFNAPDGYIGATNIITAARIAPAAFKAICKRLDMNPKLFKNSNIGHVEEHLSEAEVVKVLQFINNSKRRRS